jgi:hypothetical protein
MSPATRAVAAVLTLFVSNERARELAAEITEALEDARIDPTMVVIQVLNGPLRGLSFEERVLAVHRTVDALDRARARERMS